MVSDWVYELVIFAFNSIKGDAYITLFLTYKHKCN